MGSLILWLTLYAGIRIVSGERNKMILIAVEGLPQWFLDPRHLKRTPLAGFEDLVSAGVEAEYLLPEFPTLTTPNRVSLLTGLHPANHGIENEYMMNQTGKLFRNLESDSDIRGWWDKVHPIWLRTHREGIKTRAYWWPECKVNFGFPTSKCFREPENGENRVLSTIPEVLRELKSGKLDFVSLYYPYLARTAIKHGPHSMETYKDLQYLSTAVFSLLATIRRLTMEDSVNILVVSLTGMTSLSLHQLYFLDDYLPLSLLDKAVGTGASMQIFPLPGKEFQVFNELDGAIPHMKVYWKNQLLDRWHWKNGSYVPPLFILAEPGYGIYCRNQEKQFPRRKMEGRAEDFPRGLNGYDNAEKEMRGIFMATGPDFKKSFKSKWFRVIDVYSLIAKLMGLKSRPIDGNFSRVANLLNPIAPMTSSSPKSMGNSFCVSLLPAVFFLTVSESFMKL